ncbi:MAG: ketopantoate reductase family protein, partial [Promethearchaeota archaeon]
MDIVIYGAGAIGCVLATFIKHPNSVYNHDVHLVGRPSRLEPIRKAGYLIYKPHWATNESEYIKTAGYRLYTSIKDVPKADVVFL